MPDEPLTQDEAESAPRFKVLEGPDLARLVFQWLDRPNLIEALLVSLTVDLQLAVAQATLTKRLASRGTAVQITLVTSALQYNSRRGSEADRRWDAMVGLASAGIKVFVCQTLHAKLLLFREVDRVCWVTGSSNLTRSGLMLNQETNIRGFHPSDFEIFRSFADQLIERSRPLTKSAFEGVNSIDEDS